MKKELCADKMRSTFSYTNHVHKNHSIYVQLQQIFATLIIDGVNTEVTVIIVKNMIIGLNLEPSHSTPQHIDKCCLAHLSDDSYTSVLPQ